MTVHTSGKFGVTQKKELELLSKMERLGIRESDIIEEFLRGSGAGGQHRNKTSTRVRLFHRPSGIEVSYQRERSQALNRFFARRLLCEKIQAATLGVAPEKSAEQERISKQKARRVRRSQS